MATAEVLRARKQSATGEAMLSAIAHAARKAGDTVIESESYQGRSDWLVLFGVGAEVNDAARKAQIEKGGHVLIWDLGYFDRKKVVGHLRMSIDTDHPPQYFDNTPSDGKRWGKFGLELREDADPSGPILLIGLGRKSRLYLKAPNWERNNYKKLIARFPEKRIIFRPKYPDRTQLPCETDAQTPIADLLRGASLVVCRHSNVACDAALAGVPFEAENGAAVWLQQREFTRDNRLDFLCRLAHWQYTAKEAPQAWAFAKQMVNQ